MKAGSQILHTGICCKALTYPLIIKQIKTNSMMLPIVIATGLACFVLFYKAINYFEKI